MTEAIDGPSAGLVALIRAIATALPAHREELNRLDGVAGDGDLGLTVTTASNALLDLAPTLCFLPEAAALRKAGMELARKAPSTGGTLVAFALMGAAKAEAPADAVPVARAAMYLDAAASTLAARGQVEVGDRTMLDALRPAADALGTAADRGEDARTAAAAAAAAADEGARATATMAAKVGRAGWLANRAAGHEDAGARLVAMAVRAAADHVAGVDR